MSSDPSPRYDFSLTPLGSEDQAILDAYELMGRSVDDLPYTSDFDYIANSLGKSKTDSDKHHVFKRMLALRKRGRLPKVPTDSTFAYEQGPAPLNADDRRLVEAYEAVGRPLDDLPYTADFNRLVALLRAPETEESRHWIFKRLLSIRKRGQLPRVYRPMSSSGS